MAGLNGIDLFQYYGVIAVINAPATDSAIGPYTQTFNGMTKMFGMFALNTRDSLGQDKWHFCPRCQGLFYAGNATAGKCPADGNNPNGPGHSTGGEYVLVNDASIGLPDPVQDNWRWCNKCQGLFYGGNQSQSVCPADGQPHTVSPGTYSYRMVHDVTNFPDQSGWYSCSKCQGMFFGDKQPFAGTCPKDGAAHTASTQFHYALMFTGSHLIDQMGGHEMGHGFGLAHAWDTSNNLCGSNSPGEYCDSWDLMGGSFGFNPGGAYDPAGTGLGASTLYKLGFLSADRVWTGAPAAATISLTAINRADLAGYKMAKIVTSDLIYTVEFRRKAGWDRGVPADGVLIHQLRTRYTAGQQHWRHCNKCGGLYFAGNAPCPAGGAHAHTEGYNYALPTNPTWPGQSQWRSCSKCQGLAFYDGSRQPGQCPAGGVHDHSNSGYYTLPRDNSVGTALPTQNGWRHCVRCEGLVYSGNQFPGACVDGRDHDFSGSSDYDVPHDVQGPASTLVQDGWRWCYKCQSLTYAGLYPCPAGGLHNDNDSDDYSVPFTTSSTSGQSGWKWCSKCQGLFYEGGLSLGKCPLDGGSHDATASSDYTLIQYAATGLEQSSWWHCQKCEGLFYYDGTGQPGSCPAGLQHDKTNSSNYRVASFGSELTYLVPPNSGASWQPGMTFSDSPRGVKITVKSIDSVNSVATIAIG